MADDDIKRKVLTDATNIARTIVKEIDSIKADGVPKDIQRKLTTSQTKTKELLTEKEGDHHQHFPPQLFPKYFLE